MINNFSNTPSPVIDPKKDHTPDEFSQNDNYSMFQLLTRIVHVFTFRSLVSKRTGFHVPINGDFDFFFQFVYSFIELIQAHMFNDFL